jgi:TfoX/Sxy family transcriptional regulator of competence genes
VPFDQELAARIRDVCKEHGDFHEKRMFGGLAFMLGDKMCFGVLEDKLVARIGPENQASALKLPYVSSMDFTGKPLKGYVYVSSSAIRTTASLKKWIS